MVQFFTELEAFLYTDLAVKDLLNIARAGQTLGAPQHLLHHPREASLEHLQQNFTWMTN